MWILSDLHPHISAVCVWRNVLDASDSFTIYDETCRKIDFFSVSWRFSTSSSCRTSLARKHGLDRTGGFLVSPEKKNPLLEKKIERSLTFGPGRRFPQSFSHLAARHVFRAGRTLKTGVDRSRQVPITGRGRRRRISRERARCYGSHAGTPNDGVRVGKVSQSPKVASCARASAMPACRNGYFFFPPTTVSRHDYVRCCFPGFFSHALWRTRSYRDVFQGGRAFGLGQVRSSPNV